MTSSSVHYLSDTKYQWATTVLEGLTKQQNNGNMEKSIVFSSACEIIKRLLDAYDHSDPKIQEIHVSDPRPSESNAIPSPGFHRIRRIPVGSDKILYWIRSDPSMGLFDLGTKVILHLNEKKQEPSSSGFRHSFRRFQQVPADSLPPDSGRNRPCYNNLGL
ncbi:unnamed protein product [Adineta ricciae]|uniref:Uncharacterized protein n=1 Tax=Adineta ricciae TaxID=249248 RepID=A0A814PUA6_ADIRI|nr:unnamed protein product [Adineta ricciae]